MVNKCCICLDELKEKGTVTFDCGHIIHMCCFMELLKNDTIFCPLCRAKLKDNINFYNHLNLKLSVIIKGIHNFRITTKDINNNETEINIDIS